jgi:hypothetical protein
MTPKPWYDKGLRFECTQCGNCCRTHGEYAFVYLAPADVAAMSAELGMTPGEFRRRWCRSIDGYTALVMDEPGCPFLTADNRCAVYRARPKQCRTWPYWQENLDRETWEGPVQSCCPGIGRGPLTSAEEVERIARETEEWYEGV